MKRYFIIIGYLLIKFTLYSQEPKGFINKAPDFPKITTPNVASFNKYIDNPVSLYTGTPEVSIPLYTLADNDIQIPINLIYNSTGIKVDEEASWVGLGWNLNVGGMIVQNVVGTDDFMDTQYADILTKLNVSTNGVSTINFSSIRYDRDLHDSFSTYLYSTTSVNHAGKLNPDVFYFTYPGGSGKFYIDYRNDSIYVIKREDNIIIKINGKNNNQEISSFTITTPNGITHFYESTLLTLKDATTANVLSRTYLLKFSIYPNNKNIVQYSYKTFPISKYTKDEYLQAVIPGQQLPNLYSGEGSYYQCTDGFIEGTEYVVSSMHTRNYKIDFLTSNREDYVNGLKLDSIVITSNNQVNSAKHSYYLEYGYFQADPNSSGWTPLPFYFTDNTVGWKEDYNNKRLKLLSVTKGKKTNLNEKYDFFYDETHPLPKKTSYEVDYWGYYNGKKGADTYMPDLKYLYWEREVDTNGQDRLSDSYERWNGIAKFHIRESDINYSKTGILIGVKYPTGGYTEYVYESNTYLGYAIPSYGPQLIDPREKTVTAYDANGLNDITIKRIFIDTPKKANISIVLNKGQNQWTDIYASNQESKPVVYIGRNTPTGFDKIIKTYDFSDQCIYYANHFPNESSILLKDSLLFDIPIANNTYEYFINVCYPPTTGLNYGDSRSGYLEGSIQYIDEKVPYYNKTNVEGCGVRIKAIKSYDKKNDVIPILSKKYNYDDPNTGLTSGILHDKPVFGKTYYGALNYGGNLTTITFDNPYPILSLYLIDLIQIESKNNSNNPYGFNGGIGYKHVKEYVESNNINTGYSLSVFYDYPSEYLHNSIRIEDARNGKLLSYKAYNSNGSLLKKDSFEYKLNLNHRYIGINFVNLLNMFSRNYTNSHFTLVEYGRYDPFLHTKDGYIDIPNYTQMSIITHQLNAYDIMLTSKETLIDNISTKEKYLYNENTLQLKKKILFLENDNTLTHTYSYSNDYNWLPYKEMANKNRISEIIEEKIFRNNYFIGGALTEYKYIPTNFNGVTTMIVPSMKHFAQIKSLLYDQTTFTASGVNTSVYPKSDVDYDKYDVAGNISYINANENKTVFLWGYNFQFPIMKIEGCAYDDVVSFFPTDIGMNVNITNEQLNIIRKSLFNTNSLVTTYTYTPLLGMTSETDPRGVTTYYEYDSNNRLKLSRDLNNSILAKYNYFYSTPNTEAIINADSSTYVNKLTSAIISVTGGSGKFEYSWQLINSSGTVISNSTDNSSKFDFSCAAVGTYSIKCTITDYNANAAISVTKPITCVYAPFVVSDITGGYGYLTATYPFTAYYYSASATISGGSPSKYCTWTLYDSYPYGKVLNTYVSETMNEGVANWNLYSAPYAAGQTLVLQVRDNILSQTITVAKNMIKR